MIRTSFILLIGCLMLNSAQSQTRDPYLWPFTTESIWNMPIHKDAWKEGNHEDANIDQVGVPQRFKGEGVQLFIEDTLDPIQEYHRVRWSNRCTEHYHYKNNYIHFPDGYTWNGEENSQKNSAFALIKPDRSTIWDGTLFTRCTEGSWVAGAWFGPDRPYNLVGSGAGDVITSPDQQEDIWGHGASKMSAMGGNLRKGELTSPEDEPIRHALKFTIWAKRYLASCELFGGKSFVWPAQGADGYACGDGDNRYQGTNTDFVMGTLLALPPDVTKEDLGISTLAGRKIFDALQTYGGYVVEDAAWDNWQFFLEEEAVATDWPAGSHASITGGTFFEELQRIVSELHIIKLNTPDSIAGGPTTDYVNRLAPVACELGTFGSGEVCPPGLTVRLTSPEGGVSYPSGSELQIEAEISGDTGLVDSVQFFVNDTLFAVDTTAPYSANWSSDTDGEYTFRAVAVDTMQELFSAVDVAVYMGNRSPSVALTSPGAESFFFAGETIGLAAEAEDPDGTVRRVDFYSGGGPAGNDTVSSHSYDRIASDTVFPYEFSWNASDTGRFGLVAAVVDDGGDTVFSDTVSVRVFPDYAVGRQQVPNGDFGSDTVSWWWVNRDAEPGIVLEVLEEGDGRYLEIGTSGGVPAEGEEYLITNGFTRGLKENVKYTFAFDAAAAGTDGGSMDLFFALGEDTLLSDRITLSDPAAPADTFSRYRYILESPERGPLSIGWAIPGSALPVKIDQILLMRGARPEVSLITEDTLFVGEMAVLAAEATDEDGTVGSVAFYIDGALAEEDHSDPFGILFTPTAAQEGVISVRALATDNDQMTAESEKKILILQGTGTGQCAEAAHGGGILVYPNPSDGKVYVRAARGHEILSVTLLDASGRVLFKRQTRGENPVEIKEAGIPGSGVYILKIATSDSMILRKVSKIR